MKWDTSRFRRMEACWPTLPSMRATGEGVIFVQPIGSPDATRLNGTEGASYPFWSPNNDYRGLLRARQAEEDSCDRGYTSGVSQRGTRPRRKLGQEGRHHLRAGLGRADVAGRRRWHAMPHR